MFFNLFKWTLTVTLFVSGSRCCWCHRSCPSSSSSSSVWLGHICQSFSASASSHTCSYYWSRGRLRWRKFKDDTRAPVARGHDLSCNPPTLWLWPLCGSNNPLWQDFSRDGLPLSWADGAGGETRGSGAPGGEAGRIWRSVSALVRSSLHRHTLWGHTERWKQAAAFRRIFKKRCRSRAESRGDGVRGGRESSGTQREVVCTIWAAAPRPGGPERRDHRGERRVPAAALCTRCCAVETKDVSERQHGRHRGPRKSFIHQWWSAVMRKREWNKLQRDWVLYKSLSVKRLD